MKLLRQKLGQGGIVVAAIAGILVFLYWLWPEAVVGIGKAIGGIIAWIVTNAIGAAGSLITGFMGAIGG